MFLGFPMMLGYVFGFLEYSPILSPMNPKSNPSQLMQTSTREDSVAVCALNRILIRKSQTLYQGDKSKGHFQITALVENKKFSPVSVFKVVSFEMKLKKK